MTVVREGYLTELQTARNEVSRLIRGLKDMAAFPNLSEESKMALREKHNDLLHRGNLISAVIGCIGALDNSVSDLEADGYPDIPPVHLPTTLFDELQRGVADVEAADALFHPPPVIKITLGEATDKPA